MTYRSRSSKKLARKKMNKAVRQFFIDSARWIKAIVFFSFVAIVWFSVARVTFFAPQYRVSDVTFTDVSNMYLVDEEVHSSIEDALLWKNFFLLKSWQKVRIEREIVNGFHHVKSFAISYEDANHLVVDVQYLSPRALFAYKGWYKGIYPERILDIREPDGLVEEEVDTYGLPPYIGSGSAFDGFFYETSQARLLGDLSSLREYFGSGAWLTYIPWWHATVVYLPDRDQEVVFVHSETYDIDDQIQRWYDVSERGAQTFTDNEIVFGDIARIDVGSHPENVYMKKRE